MSFWRHDCKWNIDCLTEMFEFSLLEVLFVEAFHFLEIKFVRFSLSSSVPGQLRASIHLTQWPQVAMGFSVLAVFKTCT